MKHNNKVLSCFMAMAIAAAMVPSTGLLSVKNIVTVDAATVYTENKTGNIDGYDFELWKDRGNTSMTLLGGGAFSCEWSNINNCLFRTGKKLGSTKKYQAYNGIYIDYDVDYSPNGNSYMCVYGWTEQPTVEYYIVETWGSWRPPGNAQSLGTVYANGGAYDIYKTMRYDQPSIHGTETFAQYWSVRQTKPAMNGNNVKGRISVSKHFAAWEKAGLEMGNMYEVALNIEGYQSSGKATVKSHVLTMGKGDGEDGSPAVDDTPVTPAVPEQPEVNGIAPSGTGTGISDGFEGTGTSWEARGESVKLLLTGDMKHDGSKSLAVTGRTASWNGASVTSSELKAGETYTFSSYVAYKNSNYSSAGFEFGLQYSLNGKTNYDNLGSATAKSGEWTKLSGIVNVPSGAKDVSVYVQTTYSENNTAADLIDFYIDDVSFSGDSASSGNDTPAVTTAPNTSNPPASTGNISSSDLMAEAKKNFTSTVPADMKTGDKGKLSKVTYYSKKAQRNKPANVWLPPNYSEGKKYPVLYMNHGVMGGEDDLVSGWGVREMASNLIEKGEVQPFIIVFTQMYTDPGSERPAGITQASMDHYDDFLYDLTESLMPYMSEHYSVAEGRENTAIAGFSMGGRESLYIGMMACDKIGYVCASSPAPGIVPAQDMFLNHRGSMTESEFKFKQEPYLLMIGGGTADNVVGTFPKQYHELYDKNGVDNIWFEVQGAGHDAAVGTPLFYNYFKNLFKASSSSNSQPAVTTTTTTVIPDRILGDIDGNGSVTSADLAKLMQALVGTSTLSGDQKTNADINGDNKISILDLIMLKNILL